MTENNKVEKHGLFHWTVYTETIINAPKEKVWAALTNFNDMPQWSKGLQKIEGTLKNNFDTTVHYIFKGDLKKLKHKIVNFEEGTQFGWSDPLIPLAKDNHIYRVAALPDGRTKFIQKDEIKGFSAMLIGKMMSTIMIQTYPEFNRSLKDYIEKH